MKKIKQMFSNAEIRKIIMYICKPMCYVFVGGVILVALFGVITLATGTLESIIVSYDVKYNSLVFKCLLVAFIIILCVSFGVAVFWSLNKYRRPGGRGILKTIYSDGTSYKALANALDKDDLGKKEKM